MLLSDAAIRNRTTVFVLVVLICVVGVHSYLTLPREFTPEVPIPHILISTPYEGASPEEVETQVTVEIENELKGLKGLKEIRSVSAEGISLIDVEFESNVVIEDALQYVRDRVDLARPDLPDLAEEPVIKEFNFSDFPIMTIAISGKLGPVRMKGLADGLEEAVEQVPGVLSVDVVGVREREIRLEFDPDRLTAYTLAMPDLLNTIPSENVNISAGGMETLGMRFHLRVPAEFTEPGEADELILTAFDAKPIYLTDVITVKDAFKDRESYSRLDGAPSVTLNVKKRVGANIIDVAEEVKGIVADAQVAAPEGVKYEIIWDASRDIHMMVRDLQNNILTALILVVLVLLLFLGFRTSAIVAIVIPLSMMVSFAIIQLLGYTLNMIVLFSLVLALGMLVDNAIVIVENIYRHMQIGHGRIEAAILGTREVAWPVATSTATTVAAFFPLLFWSGIMGDFMKYLPITLIIVLSSSLFVALVISPVISSAFASPRPRQRRPIWPLRAYRRMLEIILGSGLARFATLFTAGGLLVFLALVYAILDRGVEFFPSIDPNRALITIRSPQGTHLDESNRLAREVEKRVAPFRNELDYLITNVGGGGMGFFGSVAGGSHNASLTLIFKEYELRKRPSAEAVREIRERLRDLAGAEIRVEREKEGPPTGAVVTIELGGRDLATLDQLSRRIREGIADVPGLVNLHSDLEVERPEFVFIPDRRAIKLADVDTASLGHFLQMAILGREVGTYREYNDDYDITLRLPLSQRRDLNDIFRLYVPNRFGKPVPISTLGRFEYRGGYGTIHRVNRNRVVTVTADAAEGELGPEVLKRVQKRLSPDRLELPPGYRLLYRGENEEMRKASSFLRNAFVTAVLLILLILVAQFNSLRVPFIITTTVILSLVGVLLGLIVCKMPFGVVMTGIGVISLAGVVVNNAIVLLAYTRQLQAKGMGLTEAAIEASATRLRPVLLTAATTILGLLPMATGISFDFHKFAWVLRSESSQWWRGMAVAVMFGLAFATILTLVVVPTFYVSLSKLGTRLGRLVAGHGEGTPQKAT